MDRKRTREINDKHSDPQDTRGSEHSKRRKRFGSKQYVRGHDRSSSKALNAAQIKAEVANKLARIKEMQSLMNENHASHLNLRDGTSAKGAKSGDLGISKVKFEFSSGWVYRRQCCQLEEAKQNPYYDPNLGGGDVLPKDRKSKRLKFVPKGKYVAKAQQMRQQAYIEALKQRIAESTRKVGLESKLEVSTVAIKKYAPPSVEWWDAILLRTKSYDDFDENRDRIISNTSLINYLIQHPIPIPSPQDKNAPVQKALMLTKKEQKKMRRQRRLEDQKEMTDKVRLGLMPPPPPKVKLSNLMKVLTNQAIQDPTKVEARMRREIARRHEEHLRRNEERKLTDEQRKEKNVNKITLDAAKGIWCCIFRVENLASKKFLQKIGLNARQSQLTGIVILNPSFNLVVIEGGKKSIDSYKRLMLLRMDWNEDAIDVDESLPQQSCPFGQNKCILVWEGQIKDRQFRGFRFQRCPTDYIAKDALGSGREIALISSFIKR